MNNRGYTGDIFLSITLGSLGAFVLDLLCYGTFVHCCVLVKLCSLRITPPPSLQQHGQSHISIFMGKAGRQ